MMLVYRREKCVGCGFCAQRQPQRWQLSPRDGRAVLCGGRRKGAVLRLQPQYEELQVLREVVAACPTRAIQFGHGKRPASADGLT